MYDNDQPILIKNSRQDVPTSRRFCKNVHLGMKVYRSMTVNFDISQVIEHVEMSCPQFTLTKNGPRLKTKQELAVESKIENI